MQASGRVDIHPDADLLTAFSERTLTENERQQVMAHLALCADCRHAVALAAPPQSADAEVHHVDHRSHGYGWAHWFALAASVVVVAAAVMQIPRATQPGSELEVATRERAPSAATRSQAEDDATKPADQVAGVSAPAQVAPKPNGSLAEGYESKTASDDTGQLKRDRVSTTTLGGDFRENKQQAQVASQPAAAPGRFGDLQTGAGGGAGRGVSGRSAAGAAGGVVVGIAQPSAPATSRTRADAPVPPSPATGAPAESAEENRRAAEAGRLKDEESVRSELAASTRDEDRQRAASESGKVLGQKEAAAKPAESQETLDEKARTETAPARAGYRQPEVLPMKKHPPEPETPAAKTEGSSLGAFARKLKAPLRWTVSSAGRVIRSLDGGKNWQDVAIAPEVRFRAIAVQDGTVWAGGDGGALFHSSDSGQTWTRRSLLTRGLKAAETESVTTAPGDSARGTARGFDVVRIDITPDGRVTVATSDRQSFVSTDAGQTWSQQ